MSLISDMPHTVDISRVSYAQDSLGGDTATAATAYASDEPADIQPARASVTKQYADRNQVVTHQVFLQRDPGIRLDDVMTATAGPYSGTTFRIRGFREATAGRGLAWVADVESDRESQ